MSITLFLALYTISFIKFELKYFLNYLHKYLDTFFVVTSSINLALKIV